MAKFPDFSETDQFLMGEHPPRISEREALRLVNNRTDGFEGENREKKDFTEARAKISPYQINETVQLRPKSLLLKQKPDLKEKVFIIKKISEDALGEIFLIEDSNDPEIVLPVRMASIKKVTQKNNENNRTAT